MELDLLVRQFGRIFRSDNLERGSKRIQEYDKKKEKKNNSNNNNNKNKTKNQKKKRNKAKKSKQGQRRKKTRKHFAEEDGEEAFRNRFEIRSSRRRMESPEEKVSKENQAGNIGKGIAQIQWSHFELWCFVEDLISNRMLQLIGLNMIEIRVQFIWNWRVSSIDLSPSSAYPSWRSCFFLPRHIEWRAPQLYPFKTETITRWMTFNDTPTLCNIQSNHSSLHPHWFLSMFRSNHFASMLFHMYRYQIIPCAH